MAVIAVWDGVAGYAARSAGEMCNYLGSRMVQEGLVILEHDTIIHLTSFRGKLVTRNHYMYDWCKEQESQLLNRELNRMVANDFRIDAWVTNPECWKDFDCCDDLLGWVREMRGDSLTCDVEDKIRAWWSEVSQGKPMHGHQVP